MLLALTVDPIPDFPQVPTFKQIYGKNTMNGNGLMGPAKIPEPIVAKLSKAVQEGTQSPSFLKMMEQMSMMPAWRDSKDFTQIVQTQLVNFQDFLKDLDMLKKK